MADAQLVTAGIRRSCATVQAPPPSEFPSKRPPHQITDQWRIALDDRLMSGSGLSDLSVVKVKSHGTPTQWAAMPLQARKDCIGNMPGGGWGGGLWGLGLASAIQQSFRYSTKLCLFNKASVIQQGLTRTNRFTPCL